jgi:hypothetical protein
LRKPREVVDYRFGDHNLWGLGIWFDPLEHVKRRALWDHPSKSPVEKRA